MPQGKGTYGSKVGRPKIKGIEPSKKAMPSKKSKGMPSKKSKGN
jgi:hypothetical protein